MPELAFGYLVGFFATLLLVGLHLFLQTQKQKSKAMRQVQSNLKKIGFFWSDSEAEIKPYTAGAEKADLNKSIKSILISGIAFTFMSWVGFVLQFIIMLSLRFLAVKRLERNVFDSELAANELSPTQIKIQYDKLMA
ncbi:MAG: hypothetical protein H7061_00365 [Bdellovibrionaceae bacterium]|nr:hypothetical protein [Bdellovibrio sp.]